MNDPFPLSELVENYLHAIGPGEPWERGWRTVDAVALCMDLDRQDVIDAAETSGGRLSLREGNVIAESPEMLARLDWTAKSLPVVLLIRPTYSPGSHSLIPRARETPPLEP
jgi:hypothetical protein